MLREACLVEGLLGLHDLVEFHREHRSDVLNGLAPGVALAQQAIEGLPGLGVLAALDLIFDDVEKGLAEGLGILYRHGEPPLVVWRVAAARRWRRWRREGRLDTFTAPPLLRACSIQAQSSNLPTSTWEPHPSAGCVAESHGVTTPENHLCNEG